ncbi:hypothetical protein DFH08DRAFT_1002668 [Mycena albidolilacea]|uniref:Xylanolytic transcriptional activator regulatory domain-containing protein n=1 Tax=Mycena albidolilacea TaxID=1033008 RepID=A0AAD7F2T1_9AGAR|nr:hypothetical protein DFH08DRAFT_1002668 [Mycena albidolilacea]
MAPAAKLLTLISAGISRLNATHGAQCVVRVNEFLVQNHAGTTTPIRCKNWRAQWLGFPGSWKDRVYRTPPTIFDPESSSLFSCGNSFVDFEEPPLRFIQMLLQYFLPHASQLGFFLDPDRFYERALLSLPFGDHRRPSPALLCAVYLWGIHFSKETPPPNFSEADLLHRSREYVSLDISSPVHVEQIIQAQILLGTYLMHNGSLLQAELYCSGAATLAIGYQLHKIRSARMPSDVVGQLAGDPVEEGERIRAFWAVTFLQTSLCLAFGSRRPFYVLETLGPEIDAPWPLEIADYHASVLPRDYLGQQSIKHLLIDDSFPVSTIYMLQTKASVFCTTFHDCRVTAEMHSSASPQMTSYPWLDTRISLFWQSLPPLHVFSGTADPSASRSLALSHALVAAAAIKLHRNAGAGVAAQAKTVAAASGILECLRPTLRDGNVPTVHPVVGPLCAMACSVLMAEVRTVRAFRQAWAASLGPEFTPSASTEEDALVAGVRDGLATMGVYAEESVLIAEQWKLVQEQYATL